MLILLVTKIFNVKGKEKRYKNKIKKLSKNQEIFNLNRKISVNLWCILLFWKNIYAFPSSKLKRPWSNDKQYQWAYLVSILWSLKPFLTLRNQGFSGKWLFTGPEQAKYRINFKYLVSESKKAIRNLDVNVKRHKNQLEGKIETH